MQISKIIIPVRPQPDTIAAIFLLKKFGGDAFPGIFDAPIVVTPHGANLKDDEGTGAVLIDCGGGEFDHHTSKQQTTAMTLVAKHLKIDRDPSLKKLLAYAERDDFFGQGVRSKDPINRAFGLSGLIAALNKKYPHDPNSVVNAVLPLLDAHYDEEYRRSVETPTLLEELKKTGNFSEFVVENGNDKIKVCGFASDNIHLGGYLRSLGGGAYDIVVQKRMSGHINLLTRPQKKINVATITGLIRLEELNKRGSEVTFSDDELVSTGRLTDIPEWYYDPATNSLQNGGIQPEGIPSTLLSLQEALDIVKLSLYSK